MTVFLALKNFPPALEGRHILVHSDNMTVVAFINCQGGLRSRSLYNMAFPERDARAGQTEPRSRHTVPGWGVSMRMETPPPNVSNLFTSDDNSHCLSLVPTMKVKHPKHTHTHTHSCLFHYENIAYTFINFISG